MIQLNALAPHLLLLAAAMVVVVVDAFRVRRPAGTLGVLTALVAGVAIYLDWTRPDRVLWGGQITFDGFTRAFDTVFLVALAIVAIASSGDEGRMKYAGEYYGLLMLASAGLMLTAGAGSLLMLYAGVELSTIGFMSLVGFAKRERRSAEAALKLFVTGAVASAVMLYGSSILFGILGTTLYSAIAAGPALGFGPVFWLGLAGVLAGLAFKIAAVPFHFWAADVYEGAPTAVSAFLSTASKAGGFAALLRFLTGAVGNGSEIWLPMVVVLAAASMTVGNVVAVAQTNLKRLLAYSGVAQAGYMLVAVCGAEAAGAKGLAAGSVLLYALLYAFTNVGGFLIAHAVSTATGSDEITALRGLHSRAPGLSFALLIVLFSLGGIPPLAGFVGKLYLFAAGWQGNQKALVILGAAVSVIALYYYLMVSMQSYIRDPEDDSPIRVSRPLGLAIAICVVGTLVIGVYPKPFIQLGDRAITALHRHVPPPRLLGAE